MLELAASKVANSTAFDHVGAGSSFTCNMLAGATPPRPGDSLLVDTACFRRGAWGVWADADDGGGGGPAIRLSAAERYHAADGDGGGGGGGGDAARRFRLFKVEDVRRGGGGGPSSNNYDLGSGVSFKLSELGVAPLIEGAAPGWEPLQTDAFRATAGPSLTVHR